MEIIDPKYTRVSEVLSIFQSYKVSTAALKKAQDTGILIHAAIEQYFKGSFFVVPPDIMGYFNSFLSWIDSDVGTPEIIEERFYDKDDLLTGRIDALIPLRKERTLIDFKTGAWIHLEIWQLQATFYCDLLEKNGVKRPEKMLFIQLQKDGTAPILFEMTYKKSDSEICKAALECYRYFNKKPLIHEGLPKEKENE